MWRASTATRANHAFGSDSSWTDPTSHYVISYVECWGLHSRARICVESRGWLLKEFRCREEAWFCRTRTPRNAWRPVDYGINGVPGFLKPVHAPSGDSSFAVRPGCEYSLLVPDAEKVRQQKKAVGLSGLSGLSGILVERNQSDNQINQIDQMTGTDRALSDRRTIEAFVCHDRFSQSARGRALRAEGRSGSNLARSWQFRPSALANALGVTPSRLAARESGRLGQSGL